MGRVTLLLIACLWWQPVLGQQTGLLPEVATRAHQQLREEVRSRLGADVGLQLEHVAYSPGGIHLMYAIVSDGHPLLGYPLKLNLDREGRRISLRGRLPETLPLGYPQERVRTLSLAGLQLEGAPTEGWQYLEGRWMPVVQVRVFDTLGILHRRVYETLTLRLLLEDTLSAFHRLDTTGRGRVFLPDPLTTAEKVYGDAGYADGNDANTPQLQAQRVARHLRAVQWDTLRQTYTLTGPYLKVVNRLAPDSLPVTSVSADFSFTRNQAGFEQTMVYFHVDSLQRLVQSLGFTGLTTLVEADAQATGQDQSSFTPASPPYLLFGTGGVDDGEDADVIIHEYTHALSWMAAPGTNDGQERRGLDEGICDYVAASYSQGLSRFGADRVFNWDGNNTFWPGRPARAFASYDEVQAQGIYSIGSLWCGLMMEIEDQVGQQAALKLQLQQLYLNGAFQSLTEAGENLLDADSLLFAGQYQRIIRRSLCRRGLLPTGECALADTLLAGPSRVWYWPNPVQRVLNVYTEDTGTGSEPAGLSVYTLQGVLVFRTLLASGVRMLQLPALPAGLYLLELRLPDGRRQTGRLVVQPD